MNRSLRRRRYYSGGLRLPRLGLIGLWLAKNGIDAIGSDSVLRSSIPGNANPTIQQVKGSGFYGAGLATVTGLLTTDTITATCATGSAPTCGTNGTLMFGASTNCWDVYVHRAGVLWAYWPGINVGEVTEIDASGNGHHLTALTTTTITERVDGTGSDALNLSPITGHIAIWGDSLADQLSSCNAANMLIRATVYNGGVGAETPSQVIVRLQAETDQLSTPTIFWMATNAIGLGNTTIMNDFAIAVASLTTANYLILSPVGNNTATTGTGYRTELNALKALLSAEYGDKHFDVEQFMMDHYDPSIPQDVVDVGNGITPSSLRVDETHFTDYAYGILYEYLVEAYQQLFITDSPSYRSRDLIVLPGESIPYTAVAATGAPYLINTTLVDGVLTATKAGDWCRARPLQFANWPQGADVNLQIKAKAGSCSVAINNTEFLSSDVVYAKFNLETGVVYSTTPNCTAAISPAEDGYYLCSVTILNASTSASFEVTPWNVATGDTDIYGQPSSYLNDYCYIKEWMQVNQPTLFPYVAPGTSATYETETGVYPDITANAPLGPEFQSITEWTNNADVDLSTLASTNNTRIGPKGLATYNRELAAAEIARVDKYLGA